MRKILKFTDFKVREWRARDGFKLARVLFFLLIICLPQVTSLLGWSPAVKQNEKRKLASFPSLSWNLDSWRSFSRRYESFFLDRFNMRPWLIRVNSRLKFFVLGVSPLKEITIGKDGWLFFSSASDGDPLKAYRGMTLFSDDELSAMFQSLEAWKAWFEERGIVFFILIAPDKHSVYPERLPGWARRVGPRTRTEQFIASAPPDIARIIVYPREALRKAKQTSPTYFTTDTHWTEWGAFVGAQALMDRIADAMPGLEPYRGDYELRPEYRAGGDMVTMLGLSGLLDDGDIKVISTDSASVNPADKRARTVVYGDSFSYGMLPFLEKNLNLVKHVHSAVMEKDVILREKPDIVILEVVGRYLYKLGANSPKVE